MVRLNKAFYALVRKHMIRVACEHYKEVVAFQRKYNVFVSLTEKECLKARQYEEWLRCNGDILTQTQYRDVLPYIGCNDRPKYGIRLIRDEPESYYVIHNVFTGLLKKYGTVGGMKPAFVHQMKSLKKRQDRKEVSQTIRVPLINMALENNGFTSWFFIYALLSQYGPTQNKCASFKKLVSWSKCWDSENPLDGEMLIERFVEELRVLVDDLTLSERPYFIKG